MTLSPMELYRMAETFLDTSGPGGWKAAIENALKVGMENADGTNKWTAAEIRRFVAMIKGRAAVRGWT